MTYAHICRSDQSGSCAPKVDQPLVTNGGLQDDENCSLLLLPFSGFDDFFLFFSSVVQIRAVILCQYYFLVHCPLLLWPSCLCLFDQLTTRELCIVSDKHHTLCRSASPLSIRFFSSISLSGNHETVILCQ